MRKYLHFIVLIFSCSFLLLIAFMFIKKIIFNLKNKKNILFSFYRHGHGDNILYFKIGFFFKQAFYTVYIVNAPIILYYRYNNIIFQ